MSGPPRRRPVPAITPPVFEEERPTPVTSTRTKTDTETELSPEPPTVPAISITAPTFDTAAKVPLPGRLSPSFAEAAATGPFAKTHVREGEGRTIFDLPKQAPSEKITAPNFDEAARSGPFARIKGREGDVQTVSERVQVKPDDIPLPLPAPPRAAPAKPAPAPAPARPPPARPPLEAKPTEVMDPWEYSGEIPEQAASLSSDYEGGGVELDTSGRLVAPELKARGRGKRDREDSDISSPADLLSVAMDVWPDAPPPASPSSVPRVEPVPLPGPVKPPPEPDTAPRAPPPPRRSNPRAQASPRKAAAAAAGADTVLKPLRGPAVPEPAETVMKPLRGPAASVEQSETVLKPLRGPTTEPEEQFFEESAEYERGGRQEYSEDYSSDVPMEQDPADQTEEPSDYPEYEERGSLDAQTSLENALQDSTDVRALLRSTQGSRWPGRLLKVFLLLLLAGGAAVAWLNYTGQWSSFLDGLR